MSLGKQYVLGNAGVFIFGDEPRARGFTRDVTNARRFSNKQEALDFRQRMPGLADPVLYNVYELTAEWRTVPA
jgi:hypothetical protein